MRAHVSELLIIVTGILLLGTTFGLFFMTQRVATEVQLNREVACVGRYLDGERFAPQCQQFIDKYKEGE